MNGTTEGLPNSNTLVQYTTSYPGNNTSSKNPNIMSYLNLSILTPTSSLITTSNPSGTYSCWCFDIKDDVFPGQTYTANSISMLDPSAITLFSNLYYSYPTSYPLNINLQLAFNAILWIFNMAYDYQNTNNYTYGDIQTSIWNLLFTNIDAAPGPSYVPIITDSSAPYISSNVAAILNDAFINIKNYPNIETMICKTNKIIGNLMILNYDDYNYNKPSQILCISSILDCDCCDCIDPEYIYVFNSSIKNIFISACSQPLDITQIVPFNMPSNYTIINKGMLLNNNNGIIVKTTGIYEANFSITCYPLSGNIISFKLMNVPSINGIPSNNLINATTIIGSVFFTESDSKNTNILNGNCKFTANANDTIYFVNNTLNQISLLMDSNPSSTFDQPVNASLDIVLLDSL